METQHTKGEWRMYKEAELNDFHVWKTSVRIYPFNSLPVKGSKTIICTNIFGATKIQCEANAKLIALAGTLSQKYNLEAYEDLLGVCQKVMTSNLGRSISGRHCSYVAAGKWWKEMEKAIKKATE